MQLISNRMDPHDDLYEEMIDKIDNEQLLQAAWVRCAKDRLDSERTKVFGRPDLNDEDANQMEAILRQVVLVHISNGTCDNPRECAKAALR